MRRRRWFLAAVTVIGVLEIVMGVAATRHAFATDPWFGFAFVLILVAGGWAVFIAGPAWVRNAQEPGAVAGVDHAPAAAASIEPEYPGRSWLEPIWPWQLTAGCVAAGLVVAAAAALRGKSGPAVALIGTASAALLWVDLWSWRWLGRSRGRDSDSDIIYRFGVLRFGLAMWGASTIWEATAAVSPLASQRTVVFAYLLNLVIRGVANFPLAIWGGYVWARAMAALGWPFRK